jgi:hypothetical protein
MTYTGKLFHPLDPDPSEVCLRDIAHALAQIPRFGGHASERYTVAQHSLRLAKLVPTPELRLPGLLHDAAEAYIGDIPTPLKRVPAVQWIEEQILRAIFYHFGIQDALPLDYRIQGLDFRLKLGEGQALMPDAWNRIVEDAAVEPIPFDACAEPEFCVGYRFMECFHAWGGKEP